MRDSIRRPLLRDGTEAQGDSLLPIGCGIVLFQPGGSVLQQTDNGEVLGTYSLTLSAFDTIGWFATVLGDAVEIEPAVEGRGISELLQGIVDGKIFRDCYVHRATVSAVMA